MRTETVTPNLIQLTRLRFVNAFLVREDDGFTLVDTTMGKAAGDLLGAATAAGTPIRRIALTHGHGDHVGGLDALKEHLGDSVEVLMPELDARIHAGEQVVDGKLPGSSPDLRTRPDVCLQAGDRVGSLEVIPTPGHSPGHVSYLDTRDRTGHRRRRLHVLRQAHGHEPLLPPLSVRRNGDVGQAARPRSGPNASRARTRASRRRARPGPALAARRDGRSARRLTPRSVVRLRGCRVFARGRQTGAGRRAELRRGPAPTPGRVERPRSELIQAEPERRRRRTPRAAPARARASGRGRRRSRRRAAPR